MEFMDGGSGIRGGQYTTVRDMLEAEGLMNEDEDDPEESDDVFMDRMQLTLGIADFNRLIAIVKSDSAAVFAVEENSGEQPVRERLDTIGLWDSFAAEDGDDDIDINFNPFESFKRRKGSLKGSIKRLQGSIKGQGSMKGGRRNTGPGMLLIDENVCLLVLPRVQYHSVIMKHYNCSVCSVYWLQ